METAGNSDPVDYDLDISHLKVSPTGDVDYGAMRFLRDKNPNGRTPELQRDRQGDGRPWLRLAVQEGAYTTPTKDDPHYMYDRCELRDRPLPLGTPVEYSFDLRAEAGFPIADARCVCAQIKAPYYDLDGGSPLFALRIDRGHYVATVEHLYEAKDAPIVNGSEVSRYLSPFGNAGCRDDGARAYDHHVFGNARQDYKELQVRAVLATDTRGLPLHLETLFTLCTTGVRVTQESHLPDDIFVWSRFTIAAAPTKKKDEDGVIQLFVDRNDGERRLVATAYGEFGHAGDADPKINTGPPPGEGLQYFKLGPYRDKWNIWGDFAAAIHIRDVKRRPWSRGAALRHPGS